MIIVKDKGDFDLLKRKKDIMTPLFHDDNEYNPGLYTLETSRSTANIIATWATMNHMGAEGFQVLIGHAVMMREIFIRNILRLNSVGIAIENIRGTCVDIFLRFIITGIDPQKEHDEELADDKKLGINSAYLNDFWNWYQQRDEHNNVIAFSKSNSSIYNRNNIPMVAIRIVLLGVNTDERDIERAIDEIVDLKAKFDEERSK
jgi:glutamate/tyrosine decarboxylase-like PLP-dependent enzyme